jgi:hypothetical protein
MSGTASRFQTRLGYAPGLRVGQYPGAAAPVPMAPPAAGVAPVGAAPVTPSAPMAPGGSIAPGAAAPVMAGSVRTDRQPGGYDGGGAGGSAQGDYGGPGPSGIGSTGSVVGDLAGFGREAGLAAGSLAGGPMGVAGFGLGAIASGIANAFGAPQTAAAIAQAIGLPNQAPVGYTSSGYGAEAKGTETAYGMSATPPGTPALGPSDMSAIGPAPGKDDIGAPTAEAMGGGYGDKSGADFGGADNAGADGTGSSGEASGDSNGADGGGDKMRGGYTGTGEDGILQADKVSGRHHEGEVVIPAAQVARYGMTPLMMLARGKVEPTRLASLLGA